MTSLYAWHTLIKCPPTSMDFSPACIETSTTDVGIRFEAYCKQVASAGDTHWTSCGAAELDQPWGRQVWASIHLRGSQEDCFQGLLPRP